MDSRAVRSHRSLCEMKSWCRMGCKNGPKGSGGPGALLWGTKPGQVGDNPSRVLLLILSGPGQAPWMLGVAERLPATQHPGAGEGQPEQGWEPWPGTPQWAPNQRDAEGGGTAGRANFCLLPHPALALGRTLIWKGAEIKHKPPFPSIKKAWTNQPKIRSKFRRKRKIGKCIPAFPYFFIPGIKKRNGTQFFWYCDLGGILPRKAVRRDLKEGFAFSFLSVCSS